MRAQSQTCYNTVMHEVIAFHIRSALRETHPTWAIPVDLPALTAERLAADVAAAFADLDRRQIELSRQLTPAQRVELISTLNDFLRQAQLAAIRRDEPDINEAELQRKYLMRIGIQIP